MYFKEQMCLLIPYKILEWRLLMAKKGYIYECEICGNVVETLRGGPGELVCCGKPMKEYTSKTEDTGNEKHKPVIVLKENEMVVKIGEVPHPMEEKHHIEWIEFRSTDGYVVRKEVKDQKVAEAVFCKPKNGGSVIAFCNIHGLWETKL